MQKMILQLRRRTAYLDVFMYEAIFEFACAAAKEAQLGIGIEAAMADPAAEEEVLARNPEACR